MSSAWRPMNGTDRLSGAETAEISRQIAGLATAGLPLAHGLTALGEELPPGRLRRSMSRLAESLKSGDSLDEAMENQKAKIPPHLRGLVIAGLRSGRLGDILSRFSQYVSIGTDLKRRFWLSLAYPALTVCIAATLFVFICLVVVRQFDAIYRDFGVPLPRLTIALLQVARVVNDIWVPMAIVVGAFAFMMVAGRLVLPPRLQRSLAGRLPVIGIIWLTTSRAEFCHLLALLLESDLPLPEALRLAGEGVQDARVESVSRVMADQVESGMTLAQAMAKGRLFEAGLPRLIGWAEKQKSLPAVLHVAGAMFESRARTFSTFIGTLLNVLCALAVMFLVMIVPALFIPLITLISRLSG